jgi:ABC-type uncharacterized transport system auxiliary subunit
MIRIGPLKSVLASSCFVLILMTFGCTQRMSSGSSYLLDATRPGEPAPSRGDAVLEVRRFSADAEFASSGLVYRTGEFTYETDAYHQFLISPAAMITERTRNWLSLSGLFDEVLVPGSRLEPAYTLEGNIIALYGDLRDPAAPAAVMELRCFLVADQDPALAVVFARNYRSVKPLQTDSTEGLVGALNACLTEILTNLEKGLAQSLPDLPR